MSNLEELVVFYLELCQYEKKLSQDTLKAYRIDLRQFTCFCAGREEGKDLISSYVKYLNETFSPRSVKRKLASVRAFYHTMEELEQIPQNPFDKLRLHIQYPRQLPRTIPEDLVQALLREAYSEYRRRGEDLRVLRDIVVLELLFSTGIRVSELCKLPPQTVHLNEHKLRLLISGKGRCPNSPCGGPFAVSAPAPCHAACYSAHVPPYICYIAVGVRNGRPLYSGASRP